MMKLKSALGVLVAAVLFTQTQASANVGLSTLLIQDIAVSQHAMNLVDWKIGDSMDFQVKMLFGQGTMHREVVREEGDAIWVNQDLAIMGQTQKTEMLLRRSDAAILKLLVNGQPQEIPSGGLEIIEQKHATVTVPAGTFECIYVLAKSKESAKIQLWANPNVSSMDGMLKMTQASQMGEITLSLVRFNRIP